MLETIDFTVMELNEIKNSLVYFDDALDASNLGGSEYGGLNIENISGVAGKIYLGIIDNLIPTSRSMQLRAPRIAFSGNDTTHQFFLGHAFLYQIGLYLLGAVFDYSSGYRASVGYGYIDFVGGSHSLTGAGFQSITEGDRVYIQNSISPSRSSPDTARTVQISSEVWYGGSNIGRYNTSLTGTRSASWAYPVLGHQYNAASHKVEIDCLEIGSRERLMFL
jgi:hypothetical protein